MSLRKKIHSWTQSYPICSALIKLVCYYFFIRLFIYAYIGISTPGGTIDSAFFEKYYFVPKYILFILAPIQYFFECAGYIITRIPNGIIVLGKGGVFVEFACIGLYIMAAWVALILSFPGRKKTIFLFYGFILIHILNSVRIAAVFYADITFPNKNYVAISHDIYNMIGYGGIIGLFYLWITKYSTK